MRTYIRTYLHTHTYIYICAASATGAIGCRSSARWSSIARCEPSCASLPRPPAASSARLSCAWARARSIRARPVHERACVHACRRFERARAPSPKRPSAAARSSLVSAAFGFCPPAHEGHRFHADRLVRPDGTPDRWRSRSPAAVVRVWPAPFARSPIPRSDRRLLASCHSRASARRARRARRVSQSLQRQRKAGGGSSRACACAQSHPRSLERASAHAHARPSLSRHRAGRSRRCLRGRRRRGTGRAASSSARPCSLPPSSKRPLAHRSAAPVGSRRVVRCCATR